jgi:hypothetical protein
LNRQVVSAIKGGLIGFLLVGLMVVCLTMTLGTLVSLLSLHSATISLGPIPLMSAWSDSNGYGSSSGWGLGVLCYVGGAAGVVLGLRGRPVPPEPSPSRPTEA